jgi:hypothetical protein
MPADVRRATALLVSICLLGIGSGWLRYVHERAHALQDAAPVEARHDPPVDRHHDATNCLLHAHLNLPLAPPAIVPLLVALGLLVAFLAQLEPLRLPVTVHVRFDARGPPAV